MTRSPTECLTEALGIARRVSHPVQPGESDPWSYYPDVFSDDGVRADGIRRRLVFLGDLFGGAKLPGPEGLDVLEVGSGYGLGLVTLACLGARRALGVELQPDMVDWASRCITALPPELGERIGVQVGNASALPYEDESVDVVLSVEAVSHYFDYQPFLSEAWRVLRPGGTLIISDGNNGLNPLIRRHTVALWASHEEPPGDHRTNPPDTPFHFVDKRRQIAAEACPELSDEETLDIALHTSGMVRAEVVAAARRFADQRLLPDRTYIRGQLSVHPTEEMVMERLFNPFRLARELRGYGFRTSVRGHWAGATKHRSLRLANRLLAAASPITMPTARAFRIAARKPERLE